MAIRADRVGVRHDQVDVHGRVTSPSFLNELLENLPEWTDMPVWVNGSEEVLPSNTSVPVTSPILADIAYPDIRRDNQYFTYRESPTNVDGLAKIKSIKGNTLVWNQLVQNGNFADGTNNWTAQNGTISASNGVLTYEITEVGTSTTSNRFYNWLPLYVDHTYLCLGEFKSTKADTRITAGRTTTSNLLFQIDMPSANTWYKASGIATMNANGSNLTLTYNNASSIGEVGDKIDARNIMLFDLTQMGLDISSPSDFTSLFPLSYYAYNQGTLLSFNGNGIKTVGKNQIVGRGDGNIYNGGLLFPVKQGQTIYWGGEWTGGTSMWSGVFATSTETSKNNVVVQGTYINSGEVLAQAITQDGYFGICYTGAVSNYNVTKMMASFVPFTMSEYEPYTSSTLSLPISTYFPTGMKSAGTVYDELTPTKGITRIGAVDLGSIDWSYNSTYGMYSTGISELVKKPSASNIKVNAISTVGTLTDWATFFASGTSSGLWAINTSGYLGIATTETNSTTFKNSLQGVYLYYELATPVELPTMSFE